MQSRSQTKTIRVVVADDHPVVREGLVAIIDRETDMSVVAEAADGQAAVQAVLRWAPDVTLMDLRMPEMDGVEAIQRILRAIPSSRILVLTTYDGDEDIHRALRAGAQGYLLKDLYREGLLQAIRGVIAGHRIVPPRVAVRLAEHVGRSDLTDREMDVLRLIVDGRRNREIGEALLISEETVKGHVKNVFGKLGVRDRTQAATAALQRGYVNIDDLTTPGS